MGKYVENHQDPGERRSAWLWMLASLTALWLLVGGCDSEQKDTAHKSKESAPPVTNATDETYPTPTAKIAFVSDRDGNNEIYLMNPDGTHQKRLTNDPADDQQPYFSPPTSMPDHTQHIGDEDRGLVSRTVLTRLTSNHWNDRSPAFSPDGSRIAFVSDHDGNPEVYMMDSDGSGQKRLTDNQGFDDNPVFSAHGSKLVFESNRENGDIYRMDSDGSNETRLTNTYAGENDPTVSPDGKRIAFFSSSLKGTLDIYLMDSDGSDQKKLTDDEFWEIDLAFSPNGQKIAFARSTAAGGIGYHIYVMDSDGTNLKRLTGDEVGYWVAEDFDPAWSPEGDRIAFESTRDGNYEIYVMDSDGTNVERLTDNPWNDTDPAFSSDGNKVVFVTDRDGNQEIYAATDANSK